MEKISNAERNKRLAKRIRKFVERSLGFINGLPENRVNKEVIPQAIRAVTAVGAIYEEACGAESARDFVHKLKLMRKEAREVLFWFRLFRKFNPHVKEEIDILGKECAELVKIFTSIISKFKGV